MRDSYSLPTNDSLLVIQKYVDDAFELIPKLLEAKELDVSISRWMKSKKSTLLDKFIDLRIALESLYGDESSGEFSFRVATNGSWHLGDTVEERIGYFKTLRSLYSVGLKSYPRENC